MDIAADLEKIVTALKPWTVQAVQPEVNRMDLMIQPEHLKEAVKAIRGNHWGYLSAITGLDQPATETTEGAIEVLYQFCHGAAIVTLRMAVPYSAAVLDSICDIIPAASLYERELMELLGVTLTGTPNTERLLLPDEWPDGVYPLRKSFTGLSDLNQ